MPSGSIRIAANGKVSSFLFFSFLLQVMSALPAQLAVMLELLPCLGCCELGSAGSSSGQWPYFLWMCTQKWDSARLWRTVPVLIFWGAYITVFCNSCTSATFNRSIRSSLWPKPPYGSGCYLHFGTFPYAPSQSISSPKPLEATAVLIFSHHRLVLFISEPHTNGTWVLLFLLGRRVELI